MSAPTPGEPVPTVRVLLVDDRATNLVTLEAMLGGLGLELLTARSGVDALRVLLKQDVALILLDVNMPGMDGLETAALVRQRPRSADTPIIFLTADPDQVGLHQAYSLGAVDYLLTPLDPTVLRTKVGVIADLHRRTLEVERQGERLRRAEEALRREAERTLFSTGERLRRMIESAKDYAIVGLDPEGHVTYWNAGAERLFGYSDADVLGREADVLVAAGEVAADLPRHRAQALAEARSEREAWFGRANGTRFLGNAVLTPIHGDDGALLGYTVVVRDVTEARRAEEGLRDADRRKDEFLAVLAHELRNPLAAISTAARVCRTPGHEQERAAAMDVIARQAAHLARLTDDLLDISRLTRGKVELRPDTLDLREIVDRAVDAVRHVAESRAQRVCVEHPADPVWVLGDPVRLEQVVANLLTNAAKYSPNPGVVSVSTAREDGEAAVRVRDQGEGIEPAMLDRVFDMFVQADRSLARHGGGLGIGLTLARHLVELHGGRLLAASDGPGQGSEFTLRLPVAAAPAAAASPAAASAGERRQGRVLIVDDNEDSAEMLALLLRVDGFEVATAHDGEAAIGAVRAQEPDIVLLDIGLPVMDGYQVATRIRAERPATRLVAVSGYGQEQDRRRSADAGFDHHMLKPVDHEELLRVMAALLPAHASPRV